MKLSLHLLAFGLLLHAASASAANRPAGYVTLCNEGKTCSVSTLTNVAFGRSDQFVYKQIQGSFVCNEATFGPRVAGGVNECSVPKPGSSTSSSGGAAVECLPSTPYDYAQCAQPGGRCSFSGGRHVVAGYRYRLAGDKNTIYGVESPPKIFKDGAQCTEANFPGYLDRGSAGYQCATCSMLTAGGSSSSSSSGGASSSSSGGGATCVSSGSATVEQTIMVPAGTTYDGACKTFVPAVALEGGGSVNPLPVFRLQPGATLKNVIVGGKGADGIHLESSGTLDNVRWLQPGFRAVYAAGAGEVVARNLTAENTRSRVFDIGADGVAIQGSNIVATGVPVSVFHEWSAAPRRTRFSCDGCAITGGEAVFRTNSPDSTATMTNSRVIGMRQLCVGFTLDRCVQSNVVQAP